MEIIEAHRFRITRDTDIELQEDEADDLLELLKKISGREDSEVWSAWKLQVKCPILCSKHFNGKSSDKKRRCSCV